MTSSQKCADRDVGVVIGSVFASGILATGPIEGAYYAYEPASEEILRKTRRIEVVCKRHNTPLAAAAMKFPLAHPIVAAIIPGALSPDHVQENIKVFSQSIPEGSLVGVEKRGAVARRRPGSVVRSYFLLYPPRAV